MSEFEIHAHLLVHLKMLGLDARANVVSPCRFTELKRKNVCTLDIVLLENRRPVEIVEVKNGTVRHRKGGVEGTRQGYRYRHFGVPVTFVYGMDDAAQFIADKATSSL